MAASATKILFMFFPFETNGCKRPAGDAAANRGGAPAASRTATEKGGSAKNFNWRPIARWKLQCGRELNQTHHACKPRMLGAPRNSNCFRWCTADLARRAARETSNASPRLLCRAPRRTGDPNWPDATAPRSCTKVCSEHISADAHNVRDCVPQFRR